MNPEQTEITRKNKGGRKYNLLQRHQIKTLLIKCLESGLGIRQVLSFLSQEGFPLKTTTVYEYYHKIVEEVYPDLMGERLFNVIQAINRKEMYVSMWKEKYEQTGNDEYIKLAEKSDDALVELKMRLGLLPDVTKQAVSFYSAKVQIPDHAAVLEYIKKKRISSQEKEEKNQLVKNT